MVAHINAPSGKISVTTSSARAAYPAGEAGGVCVYNAGEVPVFVKSGNSSVVATTGGNFIPAGKSRVLAKSPLDSHLSAITESGTAVLYFSNQNP